MNNYNEVKNVIHNDIGVSKEEILEVFRKIAKDEVEKIVKEDSSFIKECIRSIIKEELFNAVNNKKYPKITKNIWDFGNGEGKIKFNEYLSDIIKEEVIKQMESQFDINININKK